MRSQLEVTVPICECYSQLPSSADAQDRPAREEKGTPSTLLAANRRAGKRFQQGQAEGHRSRTLRPFGHAYIIVSPVSLVVVLSWIRGYTATLCHKAAFGGLSGTGTSIWWSQEVIQKTVICLCSAVCRYHPQTTVRRKVLT